MTIRLAGYSFNDIGVAANGLTVKAFATGETTLADDTAVGSTTTSSAGFWEFTSLAEGQYDIEISKTGSSVRRIRWDDQISLKEINIRNNTGATTPALTAVNLTNNAANQVAVFRSDRGTGNAADGDAAYVSFNLRNDNNEEHEFARITATAVDVSNGNEDGRLAFSVATGTDGGLDEIFVIDSSTGSAATISYEVDSFTIKGGEGEAGVLYLFADQGDDAGDEWKINIADGGVMTIGNDIASAGAYTAHLTITPHATIASSSVTFPGILDVNGSVDLDVSDVQVDSSGDIDLVSTNNNAAAIYLHENAGTSGTIKIHADQGTSVTEGAESINILSDAGGVGIRSTANLAKAINITSDGGTTGSIAIFNDQGTSVTEGAESISLLSDAGGVGIRSTANLANAVNITVDGGTTSSMTLFNDQGTSATEGSASIQLLSDAGGINLKSGLNGAGAVLLTADGGTSETIVIHADQGTGTGSIELLSDAGGIELDAGTDIILDAGGGDVFFKDDGTTFGSATNTSGNLIIKSGTTTALTFSGADVTVAGDLTISGDDLVMATNTAGHILVGDDTNYNPVAVSGDVTMASTGAVTIASTAVESGMLNNNVISGQTELASGGVAAADELAISDGGTLKKIGVDNFIIDTPALVTEATIANGDYVLFLDGGATGSTKKEALADLVGVIAGTVTSTGLSDSGSVLSLDIQNMTASTTIADADLIVIDDGAGGTLRKMTRANFIESAALDSINIDGGAIDGAVIGANSAAAITGTTVDATTDFTVGDLVITDGVLTDSTGLSIAAAVDLGSNTLTSTGSLQVRTIDYSDGDNAITIADGGGITFAQDVAVADSKFIEFESAAGTPTTDDKAQGIVIEFLAAEAITQWDAVYVSSTTGRVGRANSTAAGTMPAIGVAIEAQGSAGSSVRVLTHGVYRDDGGFGGNLTPGAEVYAPESDGNLTATRPSDDGDFVQVMGVAVGVRSVFINPSLTVVEHA